MFRKSLVASVSALALIGPASAQIPNPTLPQFGVTPPGVTPRQFCARNESGKCFPFMTQGPTGAINSIQGIFFAAPFLTNLSCTVDQTLNVRAAIAAAGPGTAIVWPGGCISTSDTLVQQAGQRWLGAGGIGTTTGTSFAFNNGTGAGTAIQLVGTGASLEDVSVINAGAASVAQTSSTAIVLSTGDNPTWQKLRDVYVQDWYNGIDIESGYFWRLDHVWVQSTINYGVLVRNTNYCDNGDSLISDFVAQTGTPSKTGSAGLRYESGGGLKIIGSKFLGSTYGVDVQLAPTCNTTPGTGDLIITGNSIENQSSIGIRLGVNSSGGANPKTFGATNIESNEFFQLASAVQTLPGSYNVNIASNIFAQNNIGVDVEGGDAIGVFSNNFYHSNVAGVYLAGGVGSTNVTIGPNQYASAAGGKATVVDGRGVTDATGFVDYSDQRTLALSSGTPKLNLWQLDEGANRGARVEVVIEGVVQNVGYAYHSQTFTLANNSSGVLTPTVITDQALGAKVNVNADNTTTTGSLLVGAALDSSTGSNPANLTMTIRVNGHLTAFRPL